MKPDKWNIWRIKNRWLRAAVAWAAFVAGCVAIVVGVVAMTVWAVVVGAVTEVRDSFRDAFVATRETAAEYGPLQWAAMTGKDKPV